MLPLDPEASRRLKESLYRFLEELQTTKAALYLLGHGNTYELAESYGFGRREALLAQVGTDHPLFHWVRRHRTRPAVLANPEQEPALAELLRLAGSSTMLTVPLISGETLVGFVDARDRGGRLPYGPEELAKAHQLADGLVQVLADLGLAAAPPPPPSPPAPAASETPTATGKFPQAVERLAGVAGALIQGEGIAALALTLAEGQMARCVLWAANPLEANEREAIARHQTQFAAQQGVALPPVERWGFVERPALAGEVRREEIRTALLASGSLQVLASAVGESGGQAAASALAVLSGVWELAQREQLVRRACRNLARILLEPGDVSFPHLRQHSQAVSELAQKIAQELGLSQEEEELVTLAGYLHDVGMRELDYQRIYRLDKPLEADRRLYQRHPLVGARILEASAYPGLAEAVRHHHERWDGTGYPQRLAGRNIPLAARIVHVAEVYDVLTSPSSYKRPVTREQALEVMEREAGKQFDPQLVPVLAKVVGA